MKISDKLIMSESNVIDAYISGFPNDVQTKLKKIRATIKKEAPEAEECIKYAMPTYVLQGNLVHFAAYKNHIGFYPVPSGIEAFKKELSAYKGSKGSVQFPLDKPLPLELIRKIVAFRKNENIEMGRLKNRRTCKKGHTFYKSSNCLACPICEAERKPNTLLSKLSAPARRALEDNGISRPAQLAQYSEKEILALHGIGKSTIPKLKEALKEEGLDFRQKS